MADEDYIRRALYPNLFGELDENGGDIELIKDNLLLTPMERLARADRLREAYLKYETLAQRRKREAERRADDLWMWMSNPDSFFEFPGTTREAVQESFQRPSE